jgi:hypothetical protein
MSKNKITPVPNGPLIRKKGKFSTSTLKHGGTLNIKILKNNKNGNNKKIG